MVEVPVIIFQMFSPMHVMTIVTSFWNELVVTITKELMPIRLQKRRTSHYFLHFVLAHKPMEVHVVIVST
jgi:hypothetical protein